MQPLHCCWFNNFMHSMIQRKCPRNCRCYECERTLDDMSMPWFFGAAGLAFVYWLLNPTFANALECIASASGLLTLFAVAGLLGRETRPFLSIRAGTTVALIFCASVAGLIAM